MTNIKRHLDWINRDEVRQICQPLVDHFGLTNFVYRKNYLDGSEINVSNRPDWVEHFFMEKTLIEDSLFDKHPDTYQSGYVLWTQLQGHQRILEHARQFGFDHGITIVNKMDDGVELCYFSAGSDKPEVVAHYMNNIDLLEHFIIYFKECAADILDNVKKTPILVPNKFERVVALAADIESIGKSSTREEFLQATQLKRVRLEGKYDGVVLTKREMDVISCLLKGMTSEETGRAIFLSSRTVEDYLSELRRKFDVKNKSALTQALLASDFKSVFLQE